MNYYFCGIIVSLLAVANLFSLSDQDADALIQRYAPLLKVHDDERGLPSSVSWYWNQCFLQKKRYDNKGKFKDAQDVFINGIRMVPGTITAEILGDLPNAGKDYFLKPNNPEFVYNGQPIEANGFLNAESYAHLVERKEGRENQERIVIQYMFFYPYQGALPFIPNLSHVPLSFLKKYVPLHKIGYHVGDWEHTDIYLKKVANTGFITQDYQLSQVFYARHNQRRGDFLYAHQIKELYNDDVQLDPNGTHPAVYVAKHGHGGYPRYFAGISSDADMVSREGIWWPTWRKVKNVGSLESPRPGCEWIKAKELRWGDTVEETIPFTNIEYHGNSPETPSSGGWFARAGFEKKTMEMVVQGKRVDGGRNGGFHVSIKPLKKSQSQVGHSKYFNLEVPARMRFLEFILKHPQASSFKFDVYEYKYGRRNKRIYQDLAHQTVVAMPPSTLMKNLYIDNLKIVDNEGRESKAITVNPEDIILDIYGFEE